MSHIHIPDGIVPIIWCIVGYCFSLGIVFFTLRRLNVEAIGRKIPLVGMMAAIMLLTMSVPLGFIPFHMNFTALAGILVGPGLGFAAAFVVNLVLALLGHGGITVAGINALIIGSEAVVSSFIFSTLKSKLGSTVSAAISTVTALVLSTTLMVMFLGAIGVVDIRSGEGLLHDTHEHEKHQTDLHEDVHTDSEEDLAPNNHQEGLVSGLVGYMALKGWSAVLVVIILGICLEALVTVLIIRFLLKIRPDLVEPMLNKSR